MEYKKFIISNYRAIRGPLTINVGKDSLIPVIGVNESGKTTILQAIYAFDNFNDDLNGGNHLKDISNLYGTSTQPATVAAEVSLNSANINDVFDELIADAGEDAGALLEITQHRLKFVNPPATLTLARDLNNRSYKVIEEEYSSAKLDDKLARTIIRWLPYTLYFDDFRDSVDARIEITTNKAASDWLDIVEQLFNQTNGDYSVFNLSKLEERERKSVLAKVNRRLNETLTQEWQRFRLDEVDALRIEIEFEIESVPVLKTPPPPAQPPAATTPATTPATTLPKKEPKQAPTIEVVNRYFLKFSLIETDANGDEHYFFIRDRSKGFFWFFNFVMKLEFNPKVFDPALNTIYLLDEPGSYLHASAQSKLCNKLRQLSEKNKVIYCTHSHYLLDPDIIPFSNIKVADKDEMGSVQLISINEHHGSILDRRSAFQPVLDALQIKPFLLDLTYNNVLITEGIHDYYALEMFKQSRDINILPSVGADSIPFYISLMIAWRVNYHALWDNDEAGRKAYEKAKAYFGDEIADTHFHLLPLPSAKTKNTILQDLFIGSDIHKIKGELGIPVNSSFQKMITALFYSPNKATVLGEVSKETYQNFGRLFEHIGIS